jgi:hypothetical protein
MSALCLTTLHDRPSNNSFTVCWNTIKPILQNVLRFKCRELVDVFVNLQHVPFVRRFSKHDRFPEINDQVAYELPYSMVPPR